MIEPDDATGVQVKVILLPVTAHILSIEGPDPADDAKTVSIVFLRVPAPTETSHTWYIGRGTRDLEALSDKTAVEMEQIFQQSAIKETQQ